MIYKNSSLKIIADKYQQDKKTITDFEFFSFWFAK